jgi:hypothetical protein
MGQEISKELTMKDVLDAIKENTRENKMTPNFLNKIYQEMIEQKRILNEIKRFIQLR